MNSVVIYGIRTNYLYEIVDIIEAIGITYKLYDNFEVSNNPADLAGSPFLLAAGSAKVRRELDLECKKYQMYPHPAVAHESVSISPSATLGPGTTVNRLVAIGAHSRVGAHVQINRSVSIGHGAVIGDFVSFGPAVVLAGDVVVEASAFLGAGSIVLPGVRIGEAAVIGAGAVVTKDVSAGTTVVGVPARVVRTSR